MELLSGDLLAAQATAVRSGGGVRPPGSSACRCTPCCARTRRPRCSPRIAGLLLSGPLRHRAATALGFLGCLDSASPNHVEGWAVDLGAPGRPVRLDVLVECGRRGDAHRGRAAPRHREQGFGEAACGFSAILPPHPDASAERRIAVRLAGQRTELAGSPVVVDPVPGLIGSFDTLHGMAAHGWALDRTQPDTPCRWRWWGQAARCWARRRQPVPR